MAGNCTEIFQSHVLKYRKDDLIVKEGDYGISIYRIIKGKVLIYTENEGVEIPLATFGPGEVIGEMLFLKKSMARRTASARAIEESEIEIWHPNMLSKEYEQMPAAIKYIAGQTLSRLVRMNQILSRLTIERDKNKKCIEPNKYLTDRFKYRKKVFLPFSAQLKDEYSTKIITGNIVDINLEEVGLVIENMKIDEYTFQKSLQFLIKTILPNDNAIEFQAKILSINKDKDAKKPLLRMSITKIVDPSRKNLGFYLMV